MNAIDILIAPLQGFTDAVWRCVHACVMARYGLSLTYFAPFARVEHGVVRPRDRRDIDPAANHNVDLVPQAIFRDVKELTAIIDAFTASGYSEVNLNMGCPFPLQTRKGRGAAVVGNAALLAEVADVIDRYPDCNFSIKMRPGVNTLDEWRPAMEQINAMRLTRVIVHPRRAADGYRGGIDFDTFGEILAQCRHPLYYNGDIQTIEDFNQISERFTAAAGVMIGRGVLARPSLPVEIAAGEEWPVEARRRLWLEIFSDVSRHIIDTTVGGAHQALSRLKPRLEYVEVGVIDRKLLKALKKENNAGRFLSLIETAR
ncbi:MAG: tRNA-dihydrouridine synthase family protein [Muribaculaceae bacterium]|nr:tRNA-dihydrouridine synthase family protein [Muribaculaceae bacterium]